MITDTVWQDRDRKESLAGVEGASAASEKESNGTAKQVSHVHIAQVSAARQ
ncbi:MAG: hypothetical protein NTY01_14005 [Verrucomicrobia bacterium]|nr:hypothetical protein [Verrucomicrobiota bacterium]